MGKKKLPDLNYEKIPSMKNHQLFGLYDFCGLVMCDKYKQYQVTFEQFNALNNYRVALKKEMMRRMDD